MLTTPQSGGVIVNKMLKQTSKGFRRDFILEFTKELIRSTEAYRKAVINKRIKEDIYKKNQTRQQEIKKIAPKIDVPLVVSEKMKGDAERVLQLKKSDAQQEFRLKPSMIKLVPRSPVQRSLGHAKIPELRLPETVSYLRPTPTSQYIDLVKLNPLVKDPLVKVIECNGPGEKIVVIGLMGRKSTGIILSKEEIDDIITLFSEATRIPVFEGVFRVVFGKLILAAVVSKVINSKFIITKMSETHVPALSYR